MKLPAAISSDIGLARWQKARFLPAANEYLITR
jgi:hypothetical protein